MIHRLLWLLLCLAGSVYMHPASAADARGQFGIRGAGLVSCAVFEQAREKRSEIYHVVAAWMDGYITGANQYAADTYDVASFESTELLAAMVSDYCKQHPDVLVFAVVNTLVKRFARHRLHSASQKQTVKLGERQVELYAEVIRRMQERLRARGLYHGHIDSTYSPQLGQAIGAFQKSIGLQLTGFPDQLTLWRLFNTGG